MPSARTLVELPSVLAAVSAGASAVWPDRVLGDTPEAPSERESADAGVPYRDKILVAAAATTIPLLRFCRNLVVFLLE
ncbi:hypothetical protein ALMP_19860 [Streptomyces sp. A012304]|nr:hypothetical protein ALMP_19860 [Streptomyces sp. A012304]